MHRMQAVWMQIVRMQAYCIHDVCVGEYIMCTHACMHVLVLCNWVDMVIRVGVNVHYLLLGWLCLYSLQLCM